MKTILVALDFSELSRDVEKIGYELAAKMQASVTLITVINKFVNYAFADSDMMFADQWEERKYVAGQKLEAVKNSHPEVPTNIISFIGDPKMDIIETAIEQDACFIVIGKYGRTGLSGLIVGGTAKYIVQHATKPVVVVPFKKARH